MKSIIKTIFAVLMLISITSCSNKVGNMEQMGKMKDSIFAAYPSVASVVVNVENDNSLVVALGSQDLYAQDDVKRNEVANEVGAIALHIFGKESKLEHGKIMITQNEMNTDALPTNSLISQIDFVTLRK